MLTVIKNGRVIDPYNNIDSILNIVIKDNKILELTCKDIRGDYEIDASNLIVCPGFIDIHMHEDPYNEDTETLENGIGKAMLKMGVTTCIGGNCGINTNNPIVYLDAVDKINSPVNIGLMVGHTNIRSEVSSVNKYQNIAKEEMIKIKNLTSKYLEAGCLGLSFGIRYVPGINEEELIEVSKSCKPYNKLVTAHVRNDAKYIIPSILELVNIAKKLDIPLQNSHIGSMAGYGQMEEVLKLLDSLKSSGLDISSDCYPYYAFSTGIGETTYDDGFLERYDIDYDAIEIAEGKYKGQRCTKEIFDELRKTNAQTITIGHVMKKEDIDMALLHPNIMLASDGLLHKDKGHPRASGTFPRFINNYTKKNKISLYDSINKMTTMQAKKLNLKTKGNLSTNSDADIVIFSYDEIKDTSTFENPINNPLGIKYVLIGGKVALQNGEIVDDRLGKSIRR